MDIFNYIHSPDVATHCKKIGHVFNPLEMAVIVAISDKTVKDKHAAWQQIITEYPDMSTYHEHYNFRAQKKLHDYLREFIACENNWLADFAMPAKNSVYRACLVARGDYRPSEVIGCYSTIKNTWEAVYKTCGGDSSDYRYVSIIKECLDNMDGEQKTVDFNFDREAIHAFGCGYGTTSDNVWLDDVCIYIYIPVPFEIGDLVEYKGRPLVLAHSQQVGGFSVYDENAYVYCIARDGTIDHDHVPYCKLQYYRDELRGRERFLKYLSDAFKSKHEHIEIDWLLDAFLRFQAEAENEKWSNRCYHGGRLEHAGKLL